MRPISLRSGPKILIPMGVRMPVASMSMRALIGIVQLLLKPICLSFRALSISPMRRSASCPAAIVREV